MVLKPTPQLQKWENRQNVTTSSWINPANSTESVFNDEIIVPDEPKKNTQKKLFKPFVKNNFRKIKNRLEKRFNSGNLTNGNINRIARIATNKKLRAFHPASKIGKKSFSTKLGQNRIRIATLNADCTTGPNKLYEITCMLKKNSADVAAVQETHDLKENCKFVNNYIYIYKRAR